MEWYYTSNPLNSMGEIKAETKKVKSEIANQIGKDREEVRIPNGLIELQGFSVDGECWIKLTKVIGKFNHYFQSEYCSSFRISCHVALRK